MYKMFLHVFIPVLNETKYLWLYKKKKSFENDHY